MDVWLRQMKQFGSKTCIVQADPAPSLPVGSARKSALPETDRFEEPYGIQSLPAERQRAVSHNNYH